LTESQLQQIYDKTGGRCHFCGDRITFKNRGWKRSPRGHWEVDHIRQRHKGGLKGIGNCLPACTRCNRLRWARKGPELQDLLVLGIVAAQMIRTKTSTAESLKDAMSSRLVGNAVRRSKARKHPALVESLKRRERNKVRQLLLRIRDRYR
jgi:hypothetical protein